MNFIDNEHSKFFKEKMKELKQYGKQDVYYKSLIYTLGVCETTREHLKEIFNMKKGEINIDSLTAAWQTGTSAKVTRMAFSLWNRCMYDSEEDLENRKMSSNYNPSEIFCCSYAPYFWEAIKIRYPEYTNYKQESESNSVMYERVGRAEQLECLIEEKFEDKSQNKVIGQYIRVNTEDEDAIRYNISTQIDMLDGYCKNNNIHNKIRYIDIGKSGLSWERPALERMLDDVKEGKINAILVTHIGKLFRSPIALEQLLSKKFMEDIEIISLDNSVESYNEMRELMNDIKTKLYENQDDEEEEFI